MLINTTKQKSNEWRLLEYMRASIKTDDYIAAVALIDEVRKRINKIETEKKPDKAYALLLKAADELGVGNPFESQEQFSSFLRIAYDDVSFDWEALISNSKDGHMARLATPVIQLFEERFSIMPETVLIAEAEKFVPGLKELTNNHGESHFTLTTQNKSCLLALKKLFEKSGNVEVAMADIYDYEFLDRRFDLIFSVPEMGGRLLSKSTSFICRSFDCVALENLSLHLNEMGRLVIIMPMRITFSSGKEEDLRQFIQTSYTLKELSELPEGTLERTGIKTLLVDVERKRPMDEDIIIKRYIARNKKSRREAISSLEIAEETFVMLDELVEQGGWRIENIFAQQDEEYLKFQESGTKREMLGNVAQVFRGKAIDKKKITPSGYYGVINISNIGVYELDYSSFDHINEEERKVANYLLQEGDLLLPARGTAVRTAIFHKQTYPCIASSNIIVVRPEKGLLDGTYLKLFLDSAIGNKLVSGMQQGVAIMNISYKDFASLEIPLPPIEEQKTKAKKYKEELALYKESITAAEKRWQETLEKLEQF